MELVDSHCHLDFPAFASDREAILDHCKKLGIRKIIVPGVTRAGWAGLLSLCSRHSHTLYPALGLHPLFLKRHNKNDLTELASLIAGTRPVAVGEIGLDYYSPHQDKVLQLYYFDTQLEIAEQAGLPVILHVRKAHDAVLSRLRQRQLKGGIIHAFNGSLQQAEQYLASGFKLGFGGAVTYWRAKKLRHLARQLPLSALVLETDAPDMAPVNHHGERNRPDYLPEILETLARLRNEDPQTIAARTTENIRELFPSGTSDPGPE